MKPWKLVALVPGWLLAGAAPAGRPGSPPAAALRRPGETTVFSFITARGKTASLCEGPKGSYLVYRFGTAANVELQYPAVLDTTSWHKFTYYEAHLGAGTTGAARELYQLTFMNGRFLYSLHDETYTSLNRKHEYDYRREVGVSVSVNDKTVTIAGNEASAHGSLQLEDERLDRVPQGTWP